MQDLIIIIVTVFRFKQASVVPLKYQGWVSLSVKDVQTKYPVDVPSQSMFIIGTEILFHNELVKKCYDLGRPQRVH